MLLDRLFQRPPAAKLFPILLAVWISIGSPLPAHAGLTPDGLRTEYLENPIGLDVRQPRLSWILTSSNRRQQQTAYQILVATRDDRLRSGKADLWDSGRVESGESLHIRYAGRPLDSRQTCWWKVRVWDQDGQESPWSAPAFWEMGLLQPGDWTAHWIGRDESLEDRPAPWLRRTFNLRGPVQRARVYVSGLGYYDLSINGHAVGDRMLDPAFTRYDRRVLYATHDVTRWLRPGKNCLGVVLGTGWFNCHTRAVWNFHQAPWRMSPRLLLQFHLDYSDGKTEVLVSDESWKIGASPTVFDSIYGGESYDAGLELPGWNTPSFKDSNWDNARNLAAPAGRLTAQRMPPIRLQAPIEPVAITEPAPGVYVVDFGKNIAGVAEITASGPAGLKVQWRYGERLTPDGRLDTRDIDQHIKSQGKDQAFQTDTYTLRGTGTERWHARFTYHGFQYIEVTGLRPSRDTFRALPLHSEIPRTGTFVCSDDRLNQVQAAAQRSFLNNFQGLPTDCPHREKNGWTGDAHLAVEQANFNFLPVTVHAKWIQDLIDEQRPTGELPGIVPTSGWGYDWGNGPAWDSALMLIPKAAHTYFGDTDMFERHYDAMRRYVDYLTTKADHGIVAIGLNDWAPWKTQTPADITSTAYYYVDARTVAQAARLLGRDQDAARYDTLADEIRRAFNARFLHADTATYGNGSQTSLSCALYQDLVDPRLQPAVVDRLVEAVDRNAGHLDVGILGAKYLLNALLEHQRGDVAYRIVTQTNQPGWLWWIGQGATTLWEQWNGTESRNHIMFGDVSAWFYKAIAGINPDPLAPGFRHFTIKPHPFGDLTWARGEYQSIRGLIVSDWRRVDGVFRLRVTVPANTSATVFLPARPGARVREGRQEIGNSPDLRFLRQEGDRVVLEIGSGTYEFTSEWK
ncbi:MAG: glycoside hydrolase family 78 protein [Verrucomicrobiales bacterium]|nr:glycoside hydrolase family 78 protein [Verrucomicrobiales bacterium]